MAENKKPRLDTRVLKVPRRGRDKAKALAELRAISKRAAIDLKRPYVDHAELLYDEHGLTK